MPSNYPEPDQLSDLKAVFAKKFGKGSEMYRDGLSVFASNAAGGGPGYGIPPGYAKYWEPFPAHTILHHITTGAALGSIKKHGLEPRDPSPRPWAGMKAVYMGDPSDPLYAESEQAVLEHVLLRGDRAVLLQIRTKNRLYKSVEPARTFQVVSLDPIPPEDIVGLEVLS